MIIVGGECPDCLNWVDKVIRHAFSMAPVSFTAYCERCRQEVQVETMAVSQSLDGINFRTLPPNYMRPI